MRKRTLSEFMCIEMLYDYKFGKLDPLRAQAVEECLQNSPRVRDELKKLSNGLDYCDKLKSIKISQPLLEIIATHPKPSERVLRRLVWKALPQPIRWGIEGFAVSVVLVFFVFQLEDHFKSDKIKEQSVVYKKFDLEAGESIAVPAPEPVKLPKPQVEVPVLSEAKVVAESPLILANKTLPTEVGPEKVQPALEKPVVVAPIPVAAVAIPPVAPTVVSPSPVTSTSVVPKPVVPVSGVLAGAKTETAKKGNAYVYRMVMYVNNVDKITPDLVKMMKTLGAEKAGEVELGWRRKGGSYFHFTIPQSNNQQLQDNLKKYSNFNLIKSNHPRVMPEGIERFILWVEEKKSGEEASGSSSVMPNREGQSNDGIEAP